MNLHELAARAGVATSYLGASGTPVAVRDDSIAAVLECLGVRTDLAPAKAAARYDNERAERGRVRVRWDEPPFGYFDEPEGWLISAPRRAHPFAGKFIGLFAPTYALRRARRQDVGDLASLRQLFDFGRTQGASVVLTLPLLAVFPTEPSPYSPISRLHWNELHCSIDRQSASTELIDYPQAFAAAHHALAHELASLPAADRHQLERFLDDEPDVRAYARFRFERDPSIAAAVHEYGQWRMRRELASLRQHIDDAGGMLGLDLPLGTHPEGYDAARFAAQFATGARAGAPPDAFFPGGQNWGFAPLLPHAAEEAGHSYFVASVRNHLKYASFLRIDHVMQFERLFWIPEGFTPAEGTYVYQQLDQYLAVLTLESKLHKVPIVGENLGLVSPALDRALAEHRIYGTHVAYTDLEQAANGGSLAAINTHDMPTFAAFCRGLDLIDQVELGQLSQPNATIAANARRRDVARLARICNVDPDDAAALFVCLARRMVQSSSPLAIVNVEDLWLEAAPQNVPGTSTERPNWRRPCRYPTEQFGTFTRELAAITQPPSVG